MLAGERRRGESAVSFPPSLVSFGRAGKKGSRKKCKTSPLCAEKTAGRENYQGFYARLCGTLRLHRGRARISAPTKDEATEFTRPMNFEKNIQKNGQDETRSSGESAGNLTTYEQKILDEVLDAAEPRREYVEGVKKLNFEYIFSNGDILKANENEGGIARIVVIRDGKAVLDFNDLFFGNIYRFVTPTYFQREISTTRIGHENPRGTWNFQPFLIAVGDMRDAKSLMYLLHEVGHARDYITEKHHLMETLENWKKNTGLFSAKKRTEREALIEEISSNERDAWANALKLAHTIKIENDIDLMEGFDDLDDLKDTINGAFLSFRLNLGEEMITADKGFISKIGMKIKQKLGFSESTTNNPRWEFMKSFFDKNRLRHKKTV